MVLLTMTAAAVRALSRAEEVAPEEYAKLQRPDDPALSDPKPGNPISHGQLIDLSRLLKKHAAQPFTKDETTKRREDILHLGSELSEENTEGPIPATLDALLRNSTVYIPPPLPKKEPTPEYKALMARLRAEEEARDYNRMLNPDPLAKTETFSQRFPNAAAPFSLSTPYDQVDEDELSYEEVHRQIILIINVLVSIVACAVFIWVAARHWSVPKRLGLSMGGSGAVAVAEVVVYSGYVRRIAEAKKKEKKKPEIKKIVQSWVIDGSEKMEASVSSGSKDKLDDGIRYRKGKHR
ncbi:uncharacterized protein N0V89_011009 [Didymosphaeria variabile]|uniref:Endoplasmic reticulum-based factor for assembly of V-ATPase-domain-containing protein n=1 Tax=Didymosphaeria variabile TaxID=1932322 RepID=A0A9W8XCP6_9PLEO|nr:uncharacterized protein N0V89_011009 [Didymosphaeria variabile]KAJ4347073.1 hypothetical protein N0V89_011009 [Didymosphaeria variabile]